MKKKNIKFGRDYFAIGLTLLVVLGIGSISLLAANDVGLSVTISHTVTPPPPPPTPTNGPTYSPQTIESTSNSVPNPEVTLSYKMQDGVTTISKGDSLVVDWSANNATSCKATSNSNDWAWTQNVSAKDSGNKTIIVPSVSGNYTYSLTCVNSVGASVKQSFVLNIPVEQPENPNMIITIVPQPEQVVAPTITTTTPTTQQTTTPTPNPNTNNQTDITNPNPTENNVIPESNPVPISTQNPFENILLFYTLIIIAAIGAFGLLCGGLIWLFKGKLNLVFDATNGKGIADIKIKLYNSKGKLIEETSSTKNGFFRFNLQNISPESKNTKYYLEIQSKKYKIASNKTLGKNKQGMYLGKNLSISDLNKINKSRIRIPLEKK